MEHAHCQLIPTTERSVSHIARVTATKIGTLNDLEKGIDYSAA